jgi:MoaA/NifB/PqqE/SkfB family radical SAM enzyme
VTKCNLRCTHCFYDERERITPGDRVPLIVQALVTAKPRKVIISGGEPLLHHALFEAIGGLANHGILVDVTTNATLIDKTMAVRLKEAGCGEISVSLDGASELAQSILRPRGTYAKVLKGIRHALNAGLKVDVVCGVVPDSIDAIQQWEDLAPTLGVASLTFINIFRTGNGENRSDPVLTNDDFRRVSQRVQALRQSLSPFPVRTVRLIRQSPLGECPSGRSIFYVDVAGRVGHCRWTGDRRAIAVDWSRPEALGELLDRFPSTQSVHEPDSCRNRDCVEQCGYGCPSGRGAYGVDIICDRF